MPEFLSKEALNTMIFFAGLSTLLCTAQIGLRKKFNFLSLCKVSIAVPILSIVIRSMYGVSLALVTTAEANDMPRAIWMKGYASSLYSLVVALIVTISLAAFYAITKSIYVNSSK